MSIQGKDTASGSRKLRAGIVGGGSGAFIGSVHRIAAQLDSQAEVVAGAMSSDPQRAKESAEAWYLPRSYGSFEEMAEEESKREDGIDFAMVATPNHMHFKVAKCFIEKGFHVVCDKPMTFTVEEAEELTELVESQNKIFALTHNYTGYPAVRHARDLVQQGEIGDVRKVIVSYLQDWLMEPLEEQGQKQAAWRTDPARAGISCCVGDIGTHAENLMEFITGEKIQSLLADFTTFVDGRKLEDDANILFRLGNGGKGILTSSQIAAGEENDLHIRIYGSKGGLEWRQMESNTVIFKKQGEPDRRMRRGLDYMSDSAKDASRLPPGHPEGYYEAFGNIYKFAIEDMRRVDAGESPVGGYPSVRDGLRGMYFVSKCVESAKENKWVEMPDTTRVLAGA